MRELTEIERDQLIETITLSGMGYEQGKQYIEDNGGSDEDFDKFLIDNDLHKCEQCDWYCEASDLNEDNFCQDCASEYDYDDPDADR